VGGTHADAISSPRDLDLSHEQFAVLLNALNEQGRENFTRDLIKALETAQAKNNLRPVKEVLEAWYRTLTVRRHPDYQRNLAWARESEEREALTVDDALGGLGS